MEFFIKTVDMQRAVKILSVVAKQNTTSFEGKVLIKTEEDSIKFLSNNGKTGISYVVPAKIVSTGETSVIYSKIKGFLMTFLPWDGEMGAEEFHFIKDKEKLVIKVSSKHTNGNTAKSNLKVDTLQSNDIPTIPDIDAANMILNSSIIKTAIDKVMYAVSPSNQTFFATCICMSFTPDFVRFTATDGRVLCEYKVKNECALKTGAYLLTHEFIMGLRRILVDDTQLFWEINEKTARVEFDNTLFQGYVKGVDINNDYPDYEAQFNLFENSVEIEKDLLLNGLSSFVDVLDGEDSNRVSFEIKNQTLILRTDFSKFEYENKLLPEDLDIVVDINGKDMLNTLYSISDEEVAIKFINSTSGLVVDSLGFDEQKAFVINIARR